MFYGSGAGKLPTASAVAADIVDIVKNRDRNIMTAWSDQRLTLADYKQSKRRFFVRTTDSGDQVQNAFGAVELIQLPERFGEVGVLTGEMTEEEYEKRAAKLNEVLQMIRVV